MFIQLSRPKATSSEFEHQIVRSGIEIVELSCKPACQALTQELAQLGDTEADGRRHRTHALGEVPHRQPLFEQLGAVGNQELDAIGQRRLGIDRPAAIEGPAHREIEGRGIEVGEAGEMLEQRAAGDARDGGNGRRGRLDIACLDEIQCGLDQGLAGSQATNDAAIERTRHINRESDNFHSKTNRIRIALMEPL